MKVFIKALLTGTAAAVLFFMGTGLAHADKGGNKAAIECVSSLASISFSPWLSPN